MSRRELEEEPRSDESRTLTAAIFDVERSRCPRSRHAWLGVVVPPPSSIANNQEALRAFERALQIDPALYGCQDRHSKGSHQECILSLWSSTAFQQDAVQKDVARAEQLLFEAIESN